MGRWLPSTCAKGWRAGNQGRFKGGVIITRWKEGDPINPHKRAQWETQWAATHPEGQSLLCLWNVLSLWKIKPFAALTLYWVFRWILSFKKTSKEFHNPPPSQTLKRLDDARPLAGLRATFSTQAAKSNANLLWKQPHRHTQKYLTSCLGEPLAQSSCHIKLTI